MTRDCGLEQGMRRPHLAGTFDAGLIDHARWHVGIADRDGLLSRSCTCITVIADEARRLRDLERAADAAN